METADDPSAPIQTEAMNASAPEVTLETAKSAKTMTNAVTITAVIPALTARIQLVPITASAGLDCILLDLIHQDSDSE